MVYTDGYLSVGERRGDNGPMPSPLLGAELVLSRLSMDSSSILMESLWMVEGVWGEREMGILSMGCRGTSEVSEATLKEKDLSIKK